MLQSVDPHVERFKREAIRKLEISLALSRPELVLKKKKNLTRGFLRKEGPVEGTTAIPTIAVVSVNKNSPQQETVLFTVTADKEHYEILYREKKSNGEIYVRAAGEFGDEALNDLNRTLRFLAMF